jgi:acyl-CoA thioester hydrolase
MTRPSFEMAFTALPEHIDELGHVNNAVWVQWIEKVAVEQSHCPSMTRPISG